MARMRKVMTIGGSPMYVFPEPEVAQRAPGDGDRNYEVGQTWIDESNDNVFVLTSFTSGNPVWSTSPASGATTLASLEVTGASDLQGNVAVGGTLDVTGETTVDDLVVGGNFNLGASSGQIDFTTSQAAADAIVLNASAGGVDITAGGSFDMDLTSAGGINIISTENAANSIFIEADGGSSESITLHSDQGTGVESINLESDVGGITLTSGLASADAINLEAGSGGLDVDVALQMNLTSSQNAADAIRINASAGGIDVDAAGAAGEDINIANAAGSVVVTAGESANDAIKVEATSGGIDILASSAAAGEDIDIIATGSSVNVTSTENVATAIVLSATNGGIDVTAGSTEDIDVSGSGGINIVSTEDAAAAVTIEADGGTSETVFIHSDQGTGADSVNIVSDVGGITMTAGLANDAIVMTASAGSVVATAGEDAADAIYLHADAGTSETIRLHSDQGTGEASVGLVSDVGGVTLTAGLAGDAINFDATNGSITGTAGEDAADAIYFHADAGTSETIRLHSDQGTGAASVHLESDVGGVTATSGLASTDAINLNATAGGVDIDGALEINITSSEASVADAVTISASHSAGGITLDAGATPGVTVTNGTQSFQILTGSGSPNGSVTAAQGSLYIDVGGSTSTTILFTNTDGSTTWLGVGA